MEKTGSLVIGLSLLLTLGTLFMYIMCRETGDVKSVSEVLGLDEDRKIGFTQLEVES